MTRSYVRWSDTVGTLRSSMAPLYAPGLVLPSAVRGHYRRYMKMSDVLRSKGTDVVTVAPESTVGELLALKSGLVEEGSRVRLEQRTNNLKALLERAASDGYTSFATVSAGAARDDLEIKPLA